MRKRANIVIDLLRTHTFISKTNESININTGWRDQLVEWEAVWSVVGCENKDRKFNLCLRMFVGRFTKLFS